MEEIAGGGGERGIASVGNLMMCLDMLITEAHTQRHTHPDNHLLEVDILL